MQINVSGVEDKEMTWQEFVRCEYYICTQTAHAIWRQVAHRLTWHSHHQHVTMKQGLQEFFDRQVRLNQAQMLTSDSYVVRKPWTTIPITCNMNIYFRYPDRKRDADNCPNIRLSTVELDLQEYLNTYELGNAPEVLVTNPPYRFTTIAAVRSKRKKYPAD